MQCNSENSDKILQSADSKQHLCNYMLKVRSHLVLTSAFVFAWSLARYQWWQTQNAENGSRRILTLVFKPSKSERESEHFFWCLRLFFDHYRLRLVDE